MQALFCVVNNPDRLQDVLTGLLELGVTSATIIESQGMGKIVGENVSIFAGFRDLWSGSKDFNHTLFAVIEDDQVQEAVSIIKDILSVEKSESRGVLFTIPVSNFFKLSDPR